MIATFNFPVSSGWVLNSTAEDSTAEESTVERYLTTTLRRRFCIFRKTPP